MTSIWADMERKEKGTNKGNKDKYDLLDVYYFRDLVKNRFFKPAVNFFFFIFLLIVIYFGLSSEPDLRFHGGIPFATTMIWDIWHPLLAFTIIIVGRLWCFACPIGAVGDWTQSVYGIYLCSRETPPILHIFLCFLLRWQ
jgi:hypothetical protein